MMRYAITNSFAASRPKTGCPVGGIAVDLPSADPARGERVSHYCSLPDAMVGNASEGFTLANGKRSITDRRQVAATQSIGNTPPSEAPMCFKNATEVNGYRMGSSSGSDSSESPEQIRFPRTPDKNID